MWTLVVVVTLVVAMIVGPVMMVQPNRQQRRLARLRLLASKQGLTVRLGQNPTNGEPRNLALYSRTLAQPSSKKIKPWVLGRQSLEHEINFIAEWDWVGESRPSDYVQQELRPWLQALPAPIRAVESTGNSVVFYWTESCWHRAEHWEDAAQHCVEIVKVELMWLAELVAREAQTG